MSSETSVTNDKGRGKSPAGIPLHKEILFSKNNKLELSELRQTTCKKHNYAKRNPLKTTNFNYLQFYITHKQQEKTFYLTNKFPTSLYRTFIHMLSSKITIKTTTTKNF